MGVAYGGGERGRGDPGGLPKGAGEGARKLETRVCTGVPQQRGVTPLDNKRRDYALGFGVRGGLVAGRAAAVRHEWTRAPRQAPTTRRGCVTPMMAPSLAYPASYRIYSDKVVCQLPEDQPCLGEEGLRADGPGPTLPLPAPPPFWPTGGRLCTVDRHSSHLRQLCCLARACLSNNDDDVVAFDGCEDVPRELPNRQRGRVCHICSL